jgi:hypothetical protein
MIKKLLSIALVVTAVTVNAQDFKVGAHAPHAKQVLVNLPAARGGNNQAPATTTNTLTPASMSSTGCAPLTSTTSAYYYYPEDQNTVIDTGYYFGTNSYTITQASVTYTISMQESAQKYNVVGGANITGVVFPAAIASSNAATAMISSNIYAEDPTTKGPTLPPIAPLGSSTPVALNSLSTTAMNLLPYSTPVFVNSQNFFATVVSPYFGGANADALALLGTDYTTCWPGAPSVSLANSDTLSWLLENVSNGIFYKWYSVKHFFGGQANLDLLIFPVVDVTTGVNSSVSRAGLSVFAASPNPTDGTININFSLDHSSKVDIEIYDVTGKIVKTVKGVNEVTSGKGSIAIDVTNLEAGSYMYSIATNSSKIFSKFVVAK